MSTQLFGAPVPRTQDDRLVKGEGRYLDDLVLPKMLHVALLRSPHPSATLKRIELLGLTRQELEGSKAQIYGSVLRARLNVEPEFLRALVEGMPEGDLFEIKNDSTTLLHLQAALLPRGTAAGL